MKKIFFCLLLFIGTLSCQSKSLFFAGTEFKLGENYRNAVVSVDTNLYKVENYGGTVFISDSEGKELGSFAYSRDNKIVQVAKDWGRYIDLHKAFEAFFFLIKNLPDTANYISSNEVVEPNYDQKTMRFFSGNKSINLVVYPEYVDIYENISN